MPSWKKVLISGSDAALNTLTVTNGITGSLFGTSSRAVSASFASTASYVNTLNQNVLITGSVTIASTTAGASENTLTLGPSPAGGAGEGGQLGLNAVGGTYTSASFIDNYQNQLRILRGTNAGSDALVAQWNLQTKQMQLPAYTAASSFPGTATANLAVNSNGDIITVSTSGGSVFPYTGNAVITGSLTTTGIIYAQPNGGMYFQGGDDAALYDINVANTMGIYGMQTVTEGAIKLGSNGSVLYGSGSKLGVNTTNPSSASLTVNGNVWATSFTGSLSGNASTSTSASYALTASYADLLDGLHASSFVLNSQTSSMTVLSSSYAITSSYATNTTSASYALNGGVTRIIAGTNVNISPTNGLGDVTITSFGSNLYNTATGSYGSFYDTTTQTNPVANTPRSMSINTTDISNGVSISGSTSPYNTYIKVANAGVYNIQFSAQFDRTNSGTDAVYIWLRKNGVDVVNSNTSIVLTGGVAASAEVAAWNWFVNASAGDYYQIMWESGDTHVRLLAESSPTYGPSLPSIILTAQRVDTFLSNTGSFSGSFTGQLTGSLFGTSSYAVSASNALTASYVNPLSQNVIITGSLSNGSKTTASGIYSHAEGLGFAQVGTSSININSIDNFTYYPNNYESYVISGIVSSNQNQIVASGDQTYLPALTLNPVRPNPGSINDYIPSVFIGSGSVGISINLYYYGGITISSVTYNSGTDLTTITFSPPLSSSYANIEGYGIYSSGPYSHAEGYGTIAFGTGSHAEGQLTEANGYGSHTEGYNTIVTSNGTYSHAEGGYTQAQVAYSHAEGIYTVAAGYGSHAEGYGSGPELGSFTTAYGQGSHAEGHDTAAAGTYSHAEGDYTYAGGLASHAEGNASYAQGNYSHAEGSSTYSTGDYSHAEGASTQATNNYSHAEGESTTASGVGSHAEGYVTIASGQYSHTEGYVTQASGQSSHAEGFYTIASGSYSHAEGFYTIASGLYQHVQGQYNISSSAQSAFIVGNGTSTSARSNLIFASGSQVQITGSLNATAGVQVGNTSATATSTNIGTIRYRSTPSSSYTDMVMQTGASTYDWVNIVTNTW